MTKGELISKTCEVLRESGKRKIVHVPKQHFTITDEEGHGRVFTVKGKDKTTLYTLDDIRNVFNAIISIVMDTVKHGESVYVPGIGTLKIHYREARKVRVPGTTKWKEVPAHYVPKLDCAWALKEAAKIYETYVIEKGDPLKEETPKRGRGRPKKKPVGPTDEEIREIEARIREEIMAEVYEGKLVMDEQEDEDEEELEGEGYVGEEDEDDDGAIVLEIDYGEE